MNLIVFDLEWNMGNAPKTFNYHGAELTLRGEIIQIGAVRVLSLIHISEPTRRS